MDAGLQRGQKPIPNYTQDGLYGTGYKEKHKKYEDFRVSICPIACTNWDTAKFSTAVSTIYVVIEARNFPTDCF